MDIFKELWEKNSSSLAKEKKDELEMLFGEKNFEKKFLVTKILSQSPDDDILKIYEKYNEDNKFIFTADMAPREFGETWAEGFIIEHNPDFVKSGTSLYDIDHIATGKKIEVKATRVTNGKSGGKLKERMKSIKNKDDAKDKLNFEQVKPGCCDFFVFLAVYRDGTRSWVIPSGDILNGDKIKFTRQHRGGDGSEGQVWVIPNKIKAYECDINNIYNRIENGIQTI